MRVRLWGVRGSTPVPGPAVAGFGGNTPCVRVTAADGTEMILDAGTGIRELGKDIVGRRRRVHILLTHLHLDHIQGLMFFAPMFDSEAEVTVWGPPAGGRALRDRLARYISNPLSAIEIRDLAAKVTFVDTPTEQWRIGDVEVRASLVAHRGPTLGYRLSEDGASVAYLPDHEPGLGQRLDTSEARWISGHGLARDASLLIHDAQYADEEYPAYRGWGHSSLSDALAFARRSGPRRLVLFHHAPGHDDDRLLALGAEAAARWSELGGEAAIEVAREGRAFDLSGEDDPGTALGRGFRGEREAHSG
jgi:phosphoribosyl 1,2-cyclic phosphodiesterase